MGKGTLVQQLVPWNIKTYIWKKKLVQNWFHEWCGRMKSLSRIAKSQPQAAYSAYIHGEQHRYTYILRTLPNITNILKPLDEIITNEFIPALFGTNISLDEREILSLPVKEGGLGLQSPSENADNIYRASRKITLPLKKRSSPSRANYLTTMTSKKQEQMTTPFSMQ